MNDTATALIILSFALFVLAAAFLMLGWYIEEVERWRNRYHEERRRRWDTW